LGPICVNKKMNSNKSVSYQTGEEVRVGDHVLLGKAKGKVVFVIDSQQFSSEYPQTEWAYLGSGIGIETDKYGLIHEIKSDEDLVLLNRGGE